MVPVGQMYRPEGTINLRSILSATILGVMTAIGAAFAVWFWELSPIPTLVILTPLIQGVGIGLVLAWLIGRLKLRHPKLMTTVGFLCGLGSVGLVHYAHYLHFLDQAGTQYEAMIAADDDLAPAQKAELLANKAQGSAKLADLVLVKNTGRSGFLGSMLLRADQGVQIKRMSVSGWGLWILWGVEALMVAGVASLLAHGRAATPYCEDCGTWCSKTLSPVVLAGAAAGPFAAALQADDQNAVANLIDQPTDTEALDMHRIRTNLHSCSDCDQSFADIETHETKLKKGKTETSTTNVLKLIRVSPAMTSLLRGPVMVPGVSPEHEVAEHHVIDAPAALEERDL